MPVETPEHNKRGAVREKIDEIANFLDWLDTETGLCICERSHVGGGNWLPAQATSEQIANRYFGIDETKLVAEARAVLAEIRGTAEQY